MKRSIVVGFVLAAFAGPSLAQSFAKAELFLENGLTTEAQKELIELISTSANSPDKPKALNMLASIAVDRNNPKAAIDAWNRLIRQYPASPEAVAAKRRLPILVSVVGQVAEETITDAAARVMLRNADFWAKERERIFTIDSSFIHNLDAAVFWYDKVIADHTGTTAAKVAFEEKMRSLFGWKEPGQYGRAYGMRDMPSINLMKLEDTFREYEKSFPQAAALQAFRFQIAQGFWKAKNWTKTREWLAEIVEKDGDSNSFYKDLAQRRLMKVEY